jgi:hypothetical protein
VLTASGMFCGCFRVKRKTFHRIRTWLGRIPTPAAQTSRKCSLSCPNSQSECVRDGHIATKIGLRKTHRDCPVTAFRRILFKVVV